MKTHTQKSALLAAVVVAAPLSSFAQNSYAITFDEPERGLDHGTVFTGNEYASLGGGVIFKVNSNGSHNQLIIFDTDNTGTADPDLENSFAGGNLKGIKGLGNSLIIAENLIDRNRDGLIDSPDDEALGGTISVIFGNANVQSVGFSLYDTPENKDSRVSIVFRDSSGNSKTWQPSDMIANGSNIEFANHYANEFGGISAEKLGLRNIKSIDFNIESGAVDSLSFQTVPEPSSAALLGLGALGVLLRRKRA